MAVGGELVVQLAISHPTAWESGTAPCASNKVAATVKLFKLEDLQAENLLTCQRPMRISQLAFVSPHRRPRKIYTATGKYKETE